MRGGKIVGPIANGSHVSISYTLFRYTSKLSSFSKIAQTWSFCATRPVQISDYMNTSLVDNFPVNLSCVVEAEDRMECCMTSGLVEASLERSGCK